MEQKPVRQGVPLWQVKEEPVYSTFWAGFISAIINICQLIAVNIVIFTLGGAGLSLFYPILLLQLGLAVCLLFYKRRNHMFLAESGLYIVKRGYAIYIPWEKVKAAEIVRDLPDHIRVDLAEGLMDEATDTPIVFPKDKGFRFPFSRKAGECFLQHVHVTGDERWKKRRRKRAGRMET